MYEKQKEKCNTSVCVCMCACVCVGEYACVFKGEREKVMQYDASACVSAVDSESEIEQEWMRACVSASAQSKS